MRINKNTSSSTTDPSISTNSISRSHTFLNNLYNNTISQPLSLDRSQIKIITDEPNENGSLDFESYSRTLTNIILNSKPQFSIGIIGKWGTGKTTLMRMLKKNIESNKKIMTVWFDPWRYESEEYLAVIPFLRTLNLRLQEIDSKSPWKGVKEAVRDSAVAFLYSTKLTYGFGKVASVETNFKDLIEFFNKRGVFEPDIKTIYHDSSTFIEKALMDLRKDKKDKEFRIVVFIDDLDRLRPGKALEVLESIKNFFDMEGIIYVIGIDIDRIENLIEAKYGHNNIDYDDYLQKFIQVPFRIPTWDESDVKKYLENVILKEIKGTSFYKEFSEPKHIELLLNVVKLNPRQVKRFINNIMIAKACYEKPIDELMVVYTLKYGPEDWSRFLEFIAKDDNKRKQLVEKFIKEGNPKSDEFKNSLIKEFPNLADLYKPLFEQEQDNLITDFLTKPNVAQILFNIDKMKEHIRAFNSINPKIDSKKINDSTKKSVEAGIDFIQGIDPRGTISISPTITPSTTLYPSTAEFLLTNPWTAPVGYGLKLKEYMAKRQSLEEQSKKL